MRHRQIAPLLLSLALFSPPSWGEDVISYSSMDVDSGRPQTIAHSRGRGLSFSFNHDGFDLCLFWCEKTVEIISKKTTDISHSQKSAVETKRIQISLSEMEPQRFPLYWDKLLLGGITQIDGSYNIYVTARHILAGKKKIRFSPRNNAQGIDTSTSLNLDAVSKVKMLFDREHYAVVEVISKSQSLPRSPVDILFFIPKDLSLEHLKSFLRLYSFEDLEQIKGKRWVSWQYGTVNEQATDQISSGQFRIPLNSAQILNGDLRIIGKDQPVFFWLSEGAKNFTSPRSSGSVVWVQESTQNQPLRPIGIVSCYERSSEGQGTQHFLSRIVSFGGLLQESFEFIETDLREIIEGPELPAIKNCPFTDGKGAGGFLFEENHP